MDTMIIGVKCLGIMPLSMEQSDSVHEWHTSHLLPNYQDQLYQYRSLKFCDAIHQCWENAWISEGFQLKGIVLKFLFTQKKMSAI